MAASTTEDPRIHFPLGSRQIRVLELHPGKPEDQIRCSIRVVSLDSTPPPWYEALSYSWGFPPQTHTMMLEGCPVKIGKNLHDALKHLRYRPTEDSSKIVWTDAVCIDQGNVQEKQKQIQLMGEIYLSCSKTIVWLGESAEDTESAFMMAFWLCKVAYHQIGRPDTELYGAPSLKTLIELDDVGIKWSMCRCWKELQALVTREWFSRAWVVQEGALPTEVTVVCGYYSIPWDELVVALRCLPSIPIRPLAGLPLPSHIVVIERLRQELEEKKTSLANILLRNSSCQATKDLDRVYAFLGLVQQTELKELGLDRPDYTKEFKQLCQDVTIAIIEKSGNLDLLSGPVGNPRKKHSWPSWIPDWEADQRPRCLILDQPSFNASQSKLSPVKVLISEDKLHLGVEGFVFDRIEGLSQGINKKPPSTWTFTRYQTYKTRMQDMVEFLQLCLEWEQVTRVRLGGQYRGGPELMLDAYWKTLLGGHVDAENEAAQAREFHRFDMISKHGAKALQSLGLPAWPWIMLLTPHNISVLLFRALVIRRDILGFWAELGILRQIGILHLTSDGYIGLAPPAARVGDLVSLVKGAKVPLVIRKDGEGWELVGESYVHGAMEGEVWDERKCELMQFK
ncbi:heterokaryon incompatibility protein-domain-containing protein [Cladorrhinum sp. PSN332]|nr:heterokaryon incompatibility protein-domain-containing protein [Cladorrhinum sp. PSN332]